MCCDRDVLGLLLWGGLTLFGFIYLAWKVGR